jgi:hypothetical protein
MIFHFITVVWGQEYTDFFTDVVIPNQLSPGNLPAFCSERCVYKIYTPEENRNTITNSLAFKKLNEIMAAEIVNIGQNIDIVINQHLAMSECHKAVIDDAAKSDAVIVFLSPDVFFSDGSFARLLQLAKSGKSVIMIAGVRVTKETFVSSLRRDCPQKNDCEISVSSRQLVKLMIENLHPISQTLLWDSPQFSVHPSHLYFKVSGEGLLARCYHLHPLLIKPTSERSSFSSTIDGDLVFNSYRCFKDIYVVTDSDEILGCELSNSEKRLEKPRPNKSSPFRVAWWAKQCANQYHRNYLKYKIRFKTKDCASCWADVERYSDKVVSAVNSWQKYERFFVRIPVRHIKNRVINNIKHYTRKIIINPTIRFRFSPVLLLRKLLKKLLLKLGIFYYLKEKKIKFFFRRIVRKTGAQGTIRFESIVCGGNNKVYKLSVNGSCFLLKCYFYHEQDQRDRLGAEFSFLSFAWENGVRLVPRPIACDRKNALGLYEFVEGTKLNAGEVTEQHVRQALDFLLSLNRVKNEPAAKDLPVASEACFNIVEHLFCVDRRLKQLQEIEENNSITKEAVDFVHRDLVPAWERIRGPIQERAASHGLKLDQSIGLQERCLSPSDFGLHNAILEKNGNLRFIDFEYAGWDDPAKMVCDFFCQPEVPVPIEHLPLFESAVAELSSDPQILRQKLEILLPVYKIKWCCIILNDFLAVGNERRNFAKQTQSGRRRKNQLEKARSYLYDFLRNHH